ncbi:hypothetical protein BGZ61DRAFT_542692 [Ilyonectria robusta]|uniref:uncharacterized protein n=1 Tax=Ilyonectria robusta TaxID=1079257 RepID=UPI001E8D0DCC|nr:uncharacterized protein BGZ61DRAFT_542692 [Ilyonectria robusta]KAH8645860.1 hypothetical protein BGZ61DRAFT_542692 [Ilyonectria robusta]
MPPRTTPEERKAKAAARRREKAAQKKAEKKARDEAAAAAPASPADDEEEEEEGEEEEEVVVTPLKRPSGGAAAGAAKGSKRPKPDTPSPRPALEVPDKPPSLLVDVEKVFFAEKVGGYRPIPCTRCARSMVLASAPGRFCFAYGSSGRCAHCVKGKHVCGSISSHSADLVAPARAMSMAHLAWYHACREAGTTLSRSDDVNKTEEIFSRRDQRAIAAASAAGGSKNKTNRLLRRLVVLGEALLNAASVEVPSDVEDDDSVIG